jgi:rhamnogalacturonan endolyase
MMYYDATKGRIIWKHHGDQITDVGRGMVGDIDPTQPGMEVWSFSGVYNGPTDKLTVKNSTQAPWPHLGLFWDGDILMELYNDGKIEKWNWKSPSTPKGVPRLVTTGKYGAQNAHGPNPAFHGDILGDWREEVILVSPENDELIIFTTDQPSDIRLYTLAHNPAYRNSMTLKGYVQSHHVDYFIGQGMSKPPRPNIRYVD